MKKIIISLLAVFLFVTPMQALGPNKYSYSNTIINEVKYPNIVDGVSKTQVSSLDAQGIRQESFVVEADPSKVLFEVGQKYTNPPTTWGSSTVKEQVIQAASQGKQVVAAVNADFFGANGSPIGVYVSKGVVYKDTSVASDPNFFGVKKDGTPVIGDLTLFNQIKGDLQEAVGAYHKLVVNGEAMTTFNGNSETDASIHPRTAVGIKADGTVIMFVNDGRQVPYSKGMNLKDLAQIMKNLGAVQAVNLDGGGSSTLVTKKLGSSEYQVDNKPSDLVERSVTNSIMVIAKETTPSTFKGVSLSPAHQTYLPGSSVQFSALAYDQYGGASTLPNDLVWELSNPALGSITNGVLTSNGTLGETRVVVKQNNVVVGETWVAFQQPDQLAFKDAELSIEPNQTSTLALVASFEGRQINSIDGAVTLSTEGDIGIINGLTFTANSIQGSKGKIHATFGNLTASIKVVVGQEPIVLYDFENGMGTFASSIAGAGTVATASISSFDRDEPVRFGNQALRLDFDFLNSNAATTNGVYVGPKDISSGVGETIPGNPKKIGMWVYATPEAQGYWLRSTIRDGANAAKTVDFSSSIDWIGWKYVEADISMYTGPFKTFNMQLVRMLSTKAMVDNGLKLTKGSIYIDQVRAVYGASNDDLLPPIIDSIQETLTDDGVSIETLVHDQAELNMAGINYDRVQVKVDGSKQVINVNQSTGHIQVLNLKLAGGKHLVEVKVQDLFGNETVATKVIEVPTTAFNIVSKQELEAQLGAAYNIELFAKNTSGVNGVQATFELPKDFTQVNVLFSHPESSFTYQNGQLNLDASLSSDEGQPFATIQVYVDPNLVEGIDLNYRLIQSSIKTVTNEYQGGFYLDEQIIPIKSSLQTEVISTVIGRDNKVLVTDLNGQPVQNATVKITHAYGTFTGTTNSEGVATVGKFNGPGATAIQIQANLIDAYSFIKKSQSLVAFHKSNTVVGVDQQSNEPYNIIVNTTTNQDASISWFSNVHKNTKAVLRYKLESEGVDSFVEVDGNMVEQTFMGSSTLNSNGVVNINQVSLSNLQPNERYVYQVGDGSVWSTERVLMTGDANQDETSFVVFGDTQTSDTTKLTSVLNSIDQGTQTYDFAVHVGDIVDQAGYYNEYLAVNKAFEQSMQVGSIPMIRALGNHEYMGDDLALAATSYYQMPTNSPYRGTYSTIKGDVYIAVVSWTTDEKLLKQELEWVKEDAKKANKPWQIMVTHQPIYFTNPDGGNGLFKRVVPAYAKEIGLDFVFSGHDHAYGRTREIDGTTYIVTGSTGTKYYSAVDDGSFEVYNDTKDVMYTSVVIKDNTLSLTAMRPSGEIIDTCTKQKDVYTINVTPTNLGTITASSNSVYHRMDQTYTFKPNPGVLIEDVLVDGVSVGAVSSYTFDTVSSNHELSVVFKDVTSDPAYMVGSQYIIMAQSVTSRLGQQDLTKEGLIASAQVTVYDKETGLIVDTLVDVKAFEQVKRALGIQPVTFFVVDEPETSKTMNLELVTGNLPTLMGPSFVEVNKGEAFKLQMTSEDLEDHDLTHKIVMEPVDTLVAGVVKRTIKVVDSDFNEITKEVVILVQDGSYQVGENSILKVDEVALMQRDLPLTKESFKEKTNLMMFDKTTGLLVDVWEANFETVLNDPGTYVVNVTYNQDSYMLQIMVNENTAPVFMNETFVSYHLGDLINLKDFFKVEDAQDGIISNIEIEGTVLSLVPGIYQVTAKAIDLDGASTSQKVTVLVNDGNYQKDNQFILYAVDVTIDVLSDHPKEDILLASKARVYNIETNAWLEAPELSVDLSQVPSDKKAGIYEVKISYNPTRTILLTLNTPPKPVDKRSDLPSTGLVGNSQMIGLISIGLGLLTMSLMMRKKEANHESN